jgi:alpha 1,2-mannosyltransferase
VLFTLLRKLGCKLPIECWYAGSGERDERWEQWALEEFGVVCRDAVAQGYVGHQFAPPIFFRGRSYPPGAAHGYALKPFAVLHSSFREVLFLDADNTPARDPAFLFDAPQFIEHGAVFWPDLADSRLAPDLAGLGVACSGEPGNWETGQIVVDKARCWQALALTNWYNAQAGHFYQYSWGDCGTWQAAFKRAAAPWAMPAEPPRRGGAVALVQHDFEGAPLFFHRVGKRGKWRIGHNDPTPGYEHNAECLAALERLARRRFTSAVLGL